MKSKIYGFVVFFILISIGYILKRKNIWRLNRSVNFTIEYNNNFVELLKYIYEKNYFDNEKYMWLTEKVDMMQRELGKIGIIGHYFDPLKGLKIENYELLINFLPETRSYMRELNSSIMMERFDKSANLCVDMFLRHKGKLEEQINKENMMLFNPFSCLAEAVRYVIALPFNILYWFGIIPEKVLYRIESSSLLKVVNAIIILIGFVSSIFTILLGWKEFLNILQ